MVVIPVDILKDEIYFEEEIMQYTNNEFTIALFEGEDEMNIGESARMTLKIRKPDGVIVGNYVQIVDENEAYVRWDKAEEVPTGEYVMEFTLHSGLSSFPLPPIHITIVENPNGRPKEPLELYAEYATRGITVADGTYDFIFKDYNHLKHTRITEDFYIGGILTDPQKYQIIESDEPNSLTLQYDGSLAAGQEVTMKILYTSK